MAVTGRGNYPFGSEWLRRRRRSFPSPLYKNLNIGGTATQKDVWGDWFFEAGAPVGSTGQIKVWTGASFVAKPVKIWNGSSWVTKPLKRWNGSSWITTPY